MDAVVSHRSSHYIQRNHEHLPSSNRNSASMALFLGFPFFAFVSSFVHLATAAASTSGSNLVSSNTTTSVSIPGSNLTQPVASVCGPSTANVVCIHRYGSLLPPTFARNASPIYGYPNTSVPDDPSWGLVSTADFVIFNQESGLDILGPAPKIYPKYFEVLPVIHEAPIYVPGLNKLFTTQDGPPGNLTNLVIDLNEAKPVPKAFVTDPPVYQPTGGILHDGMIYWAVQGNNASLPGGLVQRPGIVRVDPATYKAEWLCNSFYGFYFGGLNDLTVGPDGDVWFTDSGMGCSRLSMQFLRPAADTIA